MRNQMIKDEFNVHGKSDCIQCHGTGMVECSKCHGNALNYEGRQKCICNNTGKISCPSCNGSGLWRPNKKLGYD